MLWFLNQRFLGLPDGIPCSVVDAQEETFGNVVSDKFSAEVPLSFTSNSLCGGSGWTNQYQAQMLQALVYIQADLPA